MRSLSDLYRNSKVSSGVGLAALYRFTWSGNMTFEMAPPASIFPCTSGSRLTVLIYLGSAPVKAWLMLGYRRFF